MATVRDSRTLGLLASRSWTGYELTRQVQRSLRFAWATAESHLYREQARLVGLGWATVEEEPAGDRTRKRYAITTAGREALRAWLSTRPRRTVPPRRDPARLLRRPGLGRRPRRVDARDRRDVPIHPG